MNSKEIARLAGVLKATVSRVVNNSGNVKEEKTKRRKKREQKRKSKKEKGKYEF